MRKMLEERNLPELKTREEMLQILQQEEYGFLPEAPEALSQLEHNARSFEMLSKAAKESWAGKRAVAAYLPDHGCHEIDGHLGSHGLDMSEDMNIVHFYNFF
jgi:hypothetical protein